MASIDIVIPCYNYGVYVAACVGSILAQPVDLRILIIDDASSDGSADLVRGWAKSDPRISVRLHPSNRGHIETYNEGIAWAKSPLFLLLSADDMLAPGALARAIAVFEQNPGLVLAYGACPEFGPDAQPPTAEEAGDGWRVRPGRELIEEMCRTAGNPVPTPTAVVRTEAQKRIGGYKPHLPHSGDLEMWLRLAVLGDVADTGATQAFRRMHGDNMSSVIYRDVRKDYYQRRAAFDGLFAEPGLAPRDRDAWRRSAYRTLSEQALLTGLSQALRGNRRTAGDLLRFCWDLDPAAILLPPVFRLMRRQSVRRRALSMLRSGMQRSA